MAPPDLRSALDVGSRSLAGTLRMTQLHPPIERGDAAIAGGLVEHRIALGGRGERLGVAFFLHLKGVEAGAEHEHELVAQPLAGSTQLAFIPVALAQQTRLAVGAAVAE